MYGNIIYTIGSILVAASTTVRSYRFMIFGTVVLALGDIATQIAQYKIFSSWFPPSNGFASTLGLELGIGKVGFAKIVLRPIVDYDRSADSWESLLRTSSQR